MTEDAAWKDELIERMHDRCEAIVNMEVDPELGDVHERRTALGSIVTGLDDQTLAVEIGVDDQGVAFATIASYDGEGELVEPSILEANRSILVTTRVAPPIREE